MQKHPLRLVAAVAAVAVGLSACSGVSVKLAAKPSPSRTTRPTSAVSPPTRATAAQPAVRTAVELKSALVQLNDLPSGFSIEPASGSGDNGGAASSEDPKCAAFVKLSNVRTAPGSTASAGISLSGGKAGPFVDESIDALGSEHGVQLLQASLKSAVATCPQVIVTIPGQGSSLMKVVEVSAPKVGDHTFAARMTASGGALDGLEITQVTAGVKDVVVSMTFVAAYPDDVDGGTAAAVGKVEDVLTASGAGA